MDSGVEMELTQIAKIQTENALLEEVFVKLTTVE
jgi:hypothetical protein